MYSRPSKQHGEGRVSKTAYSSRAMFSRPGRLYASNWRAALSIMGHLSLCSWSTGDSPINGQSGMHAMKISRFGAIGLSQARDLR